MAQRYAVSIHARLATGDILHYATLDNERFQFTPVLRRATARGNRHRYLCGFNSRPSCDGRQKRLSVDVRVFVFQFTPVLRRATAAESTQTTPPEVSIHARLATGDDIVVKVGDGDDVSIHARLATGDGLAVERAVRRLVSIHARLATGDIAFHVAAGSSKFQFTPVLRRATRDRHLPDRVILFQFTPVLRRATKNRSGTAKIYKFQFTPVLRRATCRR